MVYERLLRYRRDSFFGVVGCWFLVVGYCFFCCGLLVVGCGLLVVVFVGYQPAMWLTWELGELASLVMMRLADRLQRYRLFLKKRKISAKYFLFPLLFINFANGLG